MRAIQNAFDPTSNSLRVNGDVSVTSSGIEKVRNATDLNKVFTYLDAGTDDERVNTIVYSSVSEGLSFTETFTWAGVPGAYRVDTIITS